MNHLRNATSPYLQQHAKNPVDWYEWGEAALRRSKQEDRPILLSIGYSSCHWCHVMAHESFEDEEIARFMNEHFINIKVDREERPDLDQIYMESVQLMTGRGGWPMTVFLTPDLKPFFGGTYFPPVDRMGMPGFPKVLHHVVELYENRREEVAEQAEKLTHAIELLGCPPEESAQLHAELIEKAVRSLLAKFDDEHGGFGGAPRFPHPLNLALLLRVWSRTRDKRLLKTVTTTLEKMAGGGIYDQLGGGFHRYAVDHKWLIPHFEKMLYDNALLARAYIEGFQATGSPLFRRIAEEIFEYIHREMTSPEGGFYSAQDADSEGEEGKFFVWTSEEIRALLGSERAPPVCRYFGVEEGGNFEHGKNVLHTSLSEQTIARLFKMTVEEFTAVLDEAKKSLFQEREGRVRPGRDDKIVTSWNGLMISALAKGYQVFREERYRERAQAAATFLLEHVMTGERVLRSWKDGRASGFGFLEDYAFFVEGLIDLYQATFEPRWLRSAISLADTMIQHFWDEDQGGFFFTSPDQKDLLLRTKDAYDQAIPSGNSVALHSLLHLSRLTERTEYLAKVESTLRSYSGAMAQSPAAFPSMLAALELFLTPSLEIVVVGDGEAPDLDEMHVALNRSFLPHASLAFRDLKNPDDSLEELIPLVRNKKMEGGKATVYICRDRACEPPITSLEQLQGRLATLAPS